MAIAAYRLILRALRSVTAAATAGGLLALGACSPTRNVAPPAHVDAAPANAAPTADASYDWHVLIIAPFGMLLKASPIALHEVLLFHDEAHSGGEVESKDCFATDAPPPRFVGHRPAEYLLCFDHDRLSRIETSVHLAAAEAARVFSQACGLWLKSSASPPSTTPPPSADRCEGRDGEVGFSAHLGAEPDGSAVPLSMTLVSIANGGAANGTAALPGATVPGAN
jgi:hypothetical protein